jgi:hypothetical protein
MECASFSQAIVNGDASVHSPVNENGALVGDRAAIHISNDDISRDFPSPGSNGTSTNLEVLKFENLSLQPLKLLPGLVVETQRSESSLFLLGGGATDWRQDKYEQNQSALQHESSVNSSSATLSRHCWLVKEWGRIFRVGVHIIEERKTTGSLLDLTSGHKYAWKNDCDWERVN